MGFLTPNASGEHDVLTTFVLQQLAQVRTSVVGLDDAGAHATASASTLNLTGLLRHCGTVAVFWSAAAAAAPGDPVIPDDMSDRSLVALVADPAALDDTLAFFDRCVDVARTNLARITDLDAAVPVPDMPWFPAELTSWQVRWVLAHLSTEIARHAGHADIIRESIDGKGSYELNDLADAQNG